MGPDRIQIESRLGWPYPLASAIAAIVEQEDGQLVLEKEAQVLEPIDNIAGVAMAPQDDRTIRLRFYIPPEEFRPIGRLEPDIFKRQATR